MTGLLRQSVVCAALTVAAGAVWSLAGRSQPAGAEAGFWFERVTFRSARLGGAMTTADLAAIEDVARGELARAFAGLPIRVTARRDATYRVRVVQAVHDPRMRGRWGVAGSLARRARPRRTGRGQLRLPGRRRDRQAPEQATRAAIVAAIGRGIGRTAVHEFTHQLLPQAPIHDSRDVRSYEFDSAARREQYFGEMHWDLARPLLVARLSR